MAVDRRERDVRHSPEAHEDGTAQLDVGTRSDVAVDVESSGSSRPYCGEGNCTVLIRTSYTDALIDPHVFFRTASSTAVDWIYSPMRLQLFHDVDFVFYPNP